MSLISLAKSIRHLENKYSAHTTRFDLEEWLRDHLINAYLGLSEAVQTEDSFKFQGAHIIYLPKQDLINLTKLQENNEVLEYSVSISNYFLNNYGLPSIQTAKESIKLQQHDFELMTLQLTESIVGWLQYTEIMNTVRVWQDHNRKSEES